MAFLAPLAAGAVAPTAGAAALASAAGAATTASTALGAGLATGATLGSGAMAAMPALSYAGANLAAPGILGALPSAVTPGIFSAASPALGGLASLTPAATTAPGIFANPATAGFLGKSFVPTVAQTAPGIFAKAAPALGNLPAGTQIPGLASTASKIATPAAQNLATQNQFIEAFRQAAANPYKGVELGKVVEVGNAGTADLIGKTQSLSRGELLARQAGQIANTPEAANLVQQGYAGQTLQNQQLAQKIAEQYASPIQPGQNFLQNAANFFKNPSMDAAGDYVKEHPYATAGAAYMAYNALKPKPKQPEQDKGMIRPYTFEYNPNTAAYSGDVIGDTSERMYFNPTFTELEPYKAAEGGIMALAVGGPVETMSAMNAVGGNMMYPQANLQTGLYSNPMIQRPEPVNVIAPSGEPAVGAYSGEPRFADGGDTKEPKTTGEYKYSYDPKTLMFTQTATPRYADAADKNLPTLNTGSKTAGGIAPPVGGPGIAALMPQAPYTGPTIPAYQSPEERLGLTDFYAMMNRRLGGYAAGGGVSDLGGYSDGGRLLKGPGDGVSDSIPAVIGDRQPARLADGEFVIPARIVSELGNGSTEAGARKLYAMMDRVQKARSKTVGKDRVATNTKADRHLPA